MTISIADLPWLPAPAETFAQAARSLPGNDPEPGKTIQALAGTRLTARQSLALARAIARCRSAGVGLTPLSDFRLGILAGNTFDMLEDCLPAAAARHGVALALTSSPYDQVLQQALDPASLINAARLDAVLVAVDHRWLNLDRARLDDPAAAVEGAIAKLRTVVDGLRRNGGAPAILSLLAAPPETLFGSYDRNIRGSVRAMIDATNHAIVALAHETGSYLLDVQSLAERIGTDRWFDPVQWVSYKLPFASEYFPAYADHLGRVLGAIRGKARKCLVLDLDNTLWGGVIGDDGIEGIQISLGHPIGEAHLSVQRLSIELRNRGVVLAVCSKNDDDVARRPFRSHPEMLLKESDIAVFQANWLDKASNLEAIAKTLNIGLDSLVLLDDNPAERAQVRAALPMVAVPELPNDPSRFAWYLASAGYFEAVSFSAEDQLRAQSYAADAQRADVLAGSHSLEDHLASLQMTLAITPFDRQGRQRITQLINKTNQFNLTTRRYTEAEVADVENSPAAHGLQVRLSDRFGDLGMIAVIICRTAEDGVWDIDTWLMSCRVLGRKVEQGMIARLVADARAAGVARLVGHYLPTARNAMVKDLFPALGFALEEETAAGERRFSLNIAGFAEPALPFGHSR